MMDGHMSRAERVQIARAVDDRFVFLSVELSGGVTVHIERGVSLDNTKASVTVKVTSKTPDGGELYIGAGAITGMAYWRENGISTRERRRRVKVVVDKVDAVVSRARSDLHQLLQWGFTIKDMVSPLYKEGMLGLDLPDDWHIHTSQRTTLIRHNSRKMYETDYADIRYPDSEVDRYGMLALTLRTLSNALEKTHLGGLQRMALPVSMLGAMITGDAVC